MLVAFVCHDRRDVCGEALASLAGLTAATLDRLGDRGLLAGLGHLRDRGLSRVAGSIELYDEFFESLDGEVVRVRHALGR